MGDMAGVPTDPNSVGAQGYSGVNDSMGQSQQMHHQAQQQQQMYPPMNQQLGTAGSGGQYYSHAY